MILAVFRWEVQENKFVWFRTPLERKKITPQQRYL